MSKPEDTYLGLFGELRSKIKIVGIVRLDHKIKDFKPQYTTGILGKKCHKHRFKTKFVFTYLNKLVITKSENTLYKILKNYKINKQTI